MAVIARRLTVHGCVQGVGFRHFVITQAAELPLDGFVRNRKDGTVDVLCVGEEQAVEALIEACRQGPAMSQVERVDIQPAQGVVDKVFRHLPTV